MSELVSEYKTPTGQTIQVRLGDLTGEEVGAIVNAANSDLAHGGGVAGAVVRAGGYEIQQESTRWVHTHGPVATGQVAVTGPGRLPCKYIIHAVGPVWRGGGQNEDDLLRQAVENSLLKAEELGLESIALPAISSGIFGFPKPRCARILLAAAMEFFRQHPQGSLRQARFTNIDQATTAIFVEELGGYLL